MTKYLNECLSRRRGIIICVLKKNRMIKGNKFFFLTLQKLKFEH
jgi:hypothetical protein